MWWRVTHRACVPTRRSRRRRRCGAYSSRGRPLLPCRCPQLPRVLQQVRPPVTLGFAVVPSSPLQVRTTTAMRVMVVLTLLLVVVVMPKAMRWGRRGGGATAIPWLCCHIERHQNRPPTLLLLPPPLVLAHLHPQETRCGISLASSSMSLDTAKYVRSALNSVSRCFGEFKDPKTDVRARHPAPASINCESGCRLVPCEAALPVTAKRHQSFRFNQNHVYNKIVQCSFVVSTMHTD
jgi:hypothetical protein